MSTKYRLDGCRVTVVGLGLMGGSLAAALRGRCRCVVGVARREETVEAARTQRLVDEATGDLAAGVRDTDVVILAMPVRAILQQLASIGPLLPEGCLLMDLGSTKAEVVAAMAQLPAHVQPLGGHPMCGKEISGLHAADPNLYRGCTFILSPLPRTSEAAVGLGRELAEATGAHALVLEPGRQDFLVATLSHLPYLLACSLVATADATTSADPAAWQIVASGFRDTSRVSGSDVTMMLDILMTNREEVLKSCSAFQAQFRHLVHILERGDEAALRQALSTLREKRQEMFP
ncbi:MAG: prephenate dehydrogenase [Anaerolineae bacterium]